MGIVFPALQRIDELTDDQQRRVAGIVMYIFQSAVGDGTSGCLQQFAVVAVGMKNTDHHFEMHGKHIGDEDRMRCTHLLGEYG